MKVDGGGLRYNEDKPRFDLMPPEALWALADLYQRGAKKYAERNWERGMDWSKPFSSMMRHCWKFWWGERFDPETGCHHMIMAAWNAISLFIYDERKIGKDDRHVTGPGEGEASPAETEPRSAGLTFEQVQVEGRPGQAYMLGQEGLYWARERG